MATFYKYQERDVDSQVNWADIGSGISNLVTDQLAERKAKKEAYDDQVRAFNQYLDEHPRGDSKNATEWTASYASKMTQQMLANQRAFKNGRVSERDNVVFMQNVQNGTKTMFDLSTEYQAEFADKMARRNSKDPANRSQELEGVIMEDFEGWANFKGTTPNIDPKTGLVVLSRKDKDGKFENVSAADLFTRIKQKVNYFDIDAVTTDMETKFGENIIGAVTKISKRGSQGEQISVEDKRTKDDFEKGLGTMIDSYLGDIYNTSSILTNSIITTNYEYTYDPEKAEKDSSLILLTKKDGVIAPDFSTTNGKEQIKVAKETMKTMFLAKIDYKKEVDVTSQIPDAPQQQEWQMLYNRGKGEEKIYTKNVVTNLSKLWGGTAEEVQAALPYFKSQDPTIQKITRENGVLLVTKNAVDSKGKLTGKTTIDRYPFKVKGTPLDYEDWIQGASLGLAGIPDVNEALDNTVEGYRTFKNHNNSKTKKELMFSTAGGVTEHNVGTGNQAPQ